MLQKNVVSPRQTWYLFYIEFPLFIRQTDSAKSTLLDAQNFLDLGLLSENSTARKQPAFIYAVPQFIAAFSQHTRFSPVAKFFLSISQAYGFDTPEKDTKNVLYNIYKFKKNYVKIMYHNEHQIMKDIYNYFYGQIHNNGVIPIDLRAPSLIGTVQDDPFDCLIEQKLQQAFPELEIVSSGKLTTPDIIIRDRKTGVIVGIEVKKLIQKVNGADSRGLTMDYNSCLPCGTALIKVGAATVDIPCYYLYALLSNDSTSIVTFILMHGDFINYDFNLHKEAKVANQTEYNHGPYGEGSVRHRAMYTYPNPLNYKLKCFHTRKVFVMKKLDCENLQLTHLVTEEVSRRDIYQNNFLYNIIDNGKQDHSKKPNLIEDIFSDCKARIAKNRTSASMPVLSK